jgi:hypothetical protein
MFSRKIYSEYLLALNKEIAASLFSVLIEKDHTNVLLGFQIECAPGWLYFSLTSLEDDTKSSSSCMAAPSGFKIQGAKMGQNVFNS